MVHAFIPSIWKAEADLSDFKASLLLHSEFQNSQDYVESPYLEKKKIMIETKCIFFKAEHLFKCVKGADLTMSHEL